MLVRMVAAAKRGERLAWGGEGRLYGRDGIGRFKVGGSLIAIRAQVPVIPLVFYGGHRAMPLGSVRARPGKIRIRFGTPIPTTGLEEESARAHADYVQEAAVRIYAELKGAALSS
ncbi:MAG: lysophospholipid acyltransferase family protein [Amylibacter sp.]